MKREQDVFQEAANGYLMAVDKFLSVQFGSRTSTDSASPSPPSDSEHATVAEDKTSTASPSDAESALQLRKIQLCSEVASVGNNIRSATWQSIASNQIDRMTETQAGFSRVETILQELNSICTASDELQRIEECRVAGDRFNESMTSYLIHWRARLQKDEERAIAAQAVLDAAKSSARLNMDAIEQYSNQASRLLGKASVTLSLGLVAGAVTALMLAYLITSGITRPLAEITDMARLASAGETGDFPIIEAGGEIGMLATAFRQMDAFYSQMGEKGRTIAQGTTPFRSRPEAAMMRWDYPFQRLRGPCERSPKLRPPLLTGDYSTEVAVRGDRDELGRAINQMIVRLRQTRKRPRTETGSRPVLPRSPCRCAESIQFAPLRSALLASWPIMWEPHLRHCICSRRTARG